METAVASDIYCKWINTKAFSWTLHNMTTLYIKCLMLHVKSSKFGDNIKHTKHVLDKLWLFCLNLDNNFDFFK